MTTPSTIKDGMHVKTNKSLGDTRGMCVAQKHLDARGRNKTGVIDGFVPGHGGDVYWIKHDSDHSIGAYTFEEFEPM